MPKPSGFSRWIAGSGWLLPLVALGVTIAAGSQLPTLEKDGRREAYIAEDDPALARRDRIKEEFGLRDPIAIAVVRDASEGIYEPGTLALVAWLTERLQAIPGVDPERVTSLATEKEVAGTADGLRVGPFLDPLPTTRADSARVREAVDAIELYRGALVSEDDRATLLLAEVVDASFDRSVYEAVVDLVDEAPRGDAELHIAGESALAGFRAKYIDDDTRRFYPLMVLGVAVVLAVGFRSLRAVVMPVAVVLATAVITIGTMAGLGVPFYVITSALPVIVVAIALADVVHLQARYQDLAAARPGEDPCVLVGETLGELWRPIVLTSVTDACGFLAIAFFTEMPPMRAFGLFAALGVLVAMVLSLLAFPPLLARFPLRSRAAALPGGREGTAAGFVRRLGRASVRRSWATLAAAGVVALLGAIAAGQIEVNDSTVAYFQPSEPVAIADRVINERFDGVHFLDLRVEAADPEGILEPAVLRRIEAAQVELETLERVNGTSSIVDHLKLIRRELHEGRPEAYRIPESSGAAQQFLFLYGASANPADFEGMIDSHHRRALIRARLDTGEYQVHRRVVSAAERLSAELAQDGLEAEVSGRVHLHTAWLKNLEPGYVKALCAATLAVWLASMVGLRSVVAGSLAMVPVLLGVALIHIVLGAGHGELQLGNSMVASIVVGIGVDFSLHVVERLRSLVRQGRTLEEALDLALPTTGRALLISGVAVMLGFGLVATSRVPSLAEFGLLIAVAGAASFVGCVTVLPALVVRLRPAALSAPASDSSERGRRADATA